MVIFFLVAQMVLLAVALWASYRLSRAIKAAKDNYGPIKTFAEMTTGFFALVWASSLLGSVWMGVLFLTWR